MVKKATTKKKKGPLVERGKQIIGKRTKDDPAFFLGQIFSTDDDEFYDIISINFNAETVMAKPNAILHPRPKSKPRKFKFFDLIQWMDL